MITISAAEGAMWLAFAINCWCIWGSVGKDRERVVKTRELAKLIDEHKAKIAEFDMISQADNAVREAISGSLVVARLAVLVHVAHDEEAKYDLVAAAQEFSHADALAAKSIAKVYEFKRYQK